MKTLNLNNRNFASGTNQSAAKSNTKNTNKLANVSPFLLLLLPVFVVMIVTFSISLPKDSDSALKTNTKPSVSVIKITKSLF
ncbi:hypothetical protein [Pedobacter flavus]|uniref:Uncharacterized protein n=1 Tax=Pedobacter flavus TaxID=3113906 RepID=A0ABU7GYZ9_9SPHI|nr:hypothetical protein [Pedobacter sp. VNH31]MEE1884238.1 hypothetical protein [Pedobacter sp. VNH31]